LGAAGRGDWAPRRCRGWWWWPSACSPRGCDLRGLREALPDAGIALVIRPDWSQPELEQRALQLGMRLSVAPLTPRDLRDITALAPQADPAAAAAEGGSASSGPAGGDAAPAGTAPHVLLVED